MILNETEAKELIQSPRNKALINSVRDQESRLRLFTEELDEFEIQGETAWRRVQQRMQDREPKNFDRVMQFARYPLPVTDITDSILTDYFKVFEGKNRFFGIESERNVSTLKEWVDNQRPENWIEENVKAAMKNKPCSFVVVDRDERGTPYLINIGTDRLVDAVIRDDGQCEYIIFIHSQRIVNDYIYTYYAVYDSESYSVYEHYSGDASIHFISSIPHDAGYCPARIMLGATSNSKNPFKRRVAFGQSLAKLEDWTIFDILTNYTDYYVPFPIIEAPLSPCKNRKCSAGYETTLEVVGGVEKPVRTKCGVCKGKATGVDNIMAGPGAVYSYKLSGNKDVQDGAGKFRMHFAETEQLKYLHSKLESAELFIRYKTVGISNLLTKESVNELQVKGSFASMETILMQNKKDLDALYKWIVSTVGALYYGNAEIHVQANFGTEFYLVNEEQLQKRYESAKAAGLPIEEQAMLYYQIIETKYKGNPMKIDRQKMVSLLDPFPLYSADKIVEWYSMGLVDEYEMNLKLNFYKFVKRFELENTSVTEFGTDLETEKRVKIILDTLNKYNDEYIQNKQLRSSGQRIESGRRQSGFEQQTT